MWIADHWKDYEVIDTSAGEKLERWGDYLLVRPDPQVIWNTPKKNKGWHQHNGHYYRSNKGGGQWEFFNLPNPVSYTHLFRDHPRTVSQSIRLINYLYKTFKDNSHYLFFILISMYTPAGISSFDKARCV